MLCLKFANTLFTRICREFEIYAFYPERFCDKNFAIRKVFAFSYSGVMCAIELSFWAAQLREGAGPVLVYLIVDWSNANSTWLIMDEMHRVDHNEEAGSPTHFEYGSFFLEDVNHVYSMRIQDLCRRSIFSMNYSLVFQVWKDLGRPLTILDHAYIVNLWPQI